MRSQDRHGDEMNVDTDIQDIRKIIKEELPILIKKDTKIRDWIIELSREQWIERASRIETKADIKFDRMMEELKRDREESMRKWEEQHEKWEEQNRKWDEYIKSQDKKWEEQNKKWEENQKEIRQLFEGLENSQKEYNRRFDTAIGALGARWGLYSEDSFRNALKGILEDLDLGLKVEHLDDYDEEGMVHGKPDSVEMDIIIKNGLLILCELKSSISKSEMFTFYRKTLFYEKKHQRKADGFIVISPMVDSKAQLAAKELGIKVYTHAYALKDESWVLSKK